MTDKSVLHGIRVLELAGLAPGPFAGMILSDFGADVVRIDPTTSTHSIDILSRGKRSIQLSLKSKKGVALMKTLLSPPPQDDKEAWRADVLIDPFRPGVLERLGLDPRELLERNPRLIICRITGFRRDGPYATMAGHDINYVALSGLAHMMGRKGEKPYAPLNFVADFAGGGLMGAFGIMLALFERSRSGKGQIVEADMLTGARYIGSFMLMHSRRETPLFTDPKGDGTLEGGAPWYDMYETKDRKHMSVGTVEPHFFKLFLEIINTNTPESLHPNPLPTVEDQYEKSLWPSMRSYFASAFLQKTRQEWTNIFLGTDACVAPVLAPREVDTEGRGWLEREGEKVGREEEAEDGSTPTPKPTLSRTPGREILGSKWMPVDNYWLQPGTHTREVLAQAGLGKDKVEELLGEHAVGSADDDEEPKAKL